MQIIVNPQIIQNKTFSDDRGSFDKIFHSGESFFDVKQINISKTIKMGSVRGIHGSRSSNEEKMVTCISGKILDVCIDLRVESKTFGKVYSAKLSDPSVSYYIPRGFGHGFQCLSDNCIIHYSHNTKYNPDDQLDISPLSKEIKKIWELDITEISSKDTQAISLEDYYNGKKQRYKNL
ncbi:dTDP-4-dehydrorhamnose 3,5-epimerase family protein [Amylibacter sp.]|nr:dTDP-4-dehydrorhamnose 3,5-epimerase family protein [Amylibacter sp.]